APGGIEGKEKGPSRIRTGDGGFAIRCLSRLAKGPSGEDGGNIAATPKPVNGCLLGHVTSCPTFRCAVVIPSGPSRNRLLSPCPPADNRAPRPRLLPTPDTPRPPPWPGGPGFLSHRGRGARL